ncbi:lipopolysaccharide heptosyltransferase I [Polynucleobacter sp. MWH-Loch1C5]|uniref:lipopolysaccharide heptosyltransferase I n=1 Tax=Polynucleobacter sp. MWH-Loch1C5 TaxID=2689108 RepID=UPI001C0D3FAB|nr:lipopolysaccharide heptosyltransferase I [Polynucleobacter sp. MWH-Loch1C5]MBU3542193.1 lipopolysaccharide heptosyltransferase I [Polynucleobacter sp. MWH-Loch1C5]
MKILLVKLSSLGDVLHNLPIVWDLRKQYPNGQIDWVVEEGYASLLDPLKTTGSFTGIDRVIPIAFRRWKKSLKRGEFVHSIQEFLTFKKELQEVQYDLIIETQGLIKSAYVTYLANKSTNARIIGLANQTEYSGYEPLARKFYTESIQVPFRCHAVDRSRYLAAAASDTPHPDRTQAPPQFYPNTYQASLQSQIGANKDLSIDQLGFDIHKPYVLCFHSTARKAKRWSNESWAVIGKELSDRGMQVVLPWGNPEEKIISAQLAKQIPQAIVPGSFSISTAFYLVANAKLTIGVDTGLTHLAAILNCPTIELYCDSPRWKTEGYWSEQVINLGDTQAPPSIEEVRQAINKLID